MALPTFYATGLASVANGATTITFSGALLGTADLPTFRAGDEFFAPGQPEVPGQRLTSVNYEDGTAELWRPWPGASLTAAAYEVRFVDDGARSTAQTRRYLEMLGQLQALGIQPNAVGALLDRDSYDAAAKGFIFLSVSPAPWTLYAKLSADEGDWDAGFVVEGAQGAPGNDGVQSSDDSVTDIVAMTQAEYDALTPNPTTFYIITD